MGPITEAWLEYQKASVVSQFRLSKAECTEVNRRTRVAYAKYKMAAGDWAPVEIIKK